MIDSKELRIGSLVNTPNGYGTIVEIVDKNHSNKRGTTFHRYVSVSYAGKMTLRQWTLGELTPIPLTDEVLGKIEGFEKANHTHGLWSKVISNSDTSSPTTAVFIPGCQDLEICRSGIGALRIKCSYLHTLQNFFSLTQTELKIEL